MAFTTVADLASEVVTNGKFQRVTSRRIIQTSASSAAGKWHEAFTAGGDSTGSLTNTAGVGIAYSSTSAGAISLSQPVVSTDELRLLSMSCNPAVGVTTVPGQIMLADILYVYPSCVLTGSPTAFDNTAAKPTRFNNGAQVQCALIVNSALDANTPALTITYTDQDGNGSATGSLAAGSVSLPTGSFIASGPAGFNGGPNMLLAAGDSGVRQLDSYTIDAGSATGSASFVLYRKVASVPIIAAAIPNERDFLFQFMSLPKIDDSACLTFFFNNSNTVTTNQTILAELGIVWG